MLMLTSLPPVLSCLVAGVRCPVPRPTPGAGGVPPVALTVPLGCAVRPTNGVAPPTAGCGLAAGLRSPGLVARTWRGVGWASCEWPTDAVDCNADGQSFQPTSGVASA